MRKGYILFAFMWMCLHASGQSAPEALKLIKEVTQKFNKVRDYQVDAEIDARISFLKILPQKLRSLMHSKIK